MGLPIAEPRLSNLKKLRTMGLTYRAIGVVYGTSDVQVYYWLNGRNVEHLRAKPEVCELCHKPRVLNHHHWDDPSLGIWLCPGCHMVAEILDRVPRFSQMYFYLKSDIQDSFASKSESQ